MKKIIWLAAALLLLLVGVLVFNTLSLKSKQLVKPDGKARVLPVDEKAVDALAQAIRIPTISYDDTAFSNPQPFDSFFVFLQQRYPLVFEKLDDTLINGKSILLRWNGRNPNARPVIFYAHLDVVPAEENTLKEWKQPPFSGAVQNGFIWGRGALDDKGSLIGLLEAATRLLNKGFTPERTVYLAFGSDEEIGGINGAAQMAAYLKAQGIKFEFYIDEGGMVTEGIVPNIKRPVALIGTAEKGYVTLHLQVSMDGGHSSRPPKESAVDVLVNAVKKIHDNPAARSTPEPVEEFLDFVGPETGMPLKMVFANRWLFKPLILNEYEKSAEGAALLRTTGVTTVVQAGVKENVIPTKVSAKVNFRILTGETAAQVQQRIAQIVNDERVVITPGEVNEPSRNSSSSTYGFGLLQQTAAQVFPDAIVTPFLMLASTDSKHFQDITDNTYRFFPARMNSELLGGIHGINERIAVQSFMETILFYETMMSNLK